jgi:CHAT domain-containing protein/tetratricopeptide (TPR) repeat protein
MLKEFLLNLLLIPSLSFNQLDSRETVQNFLLVGKDEREGFLRQNNLSETQMLKELLVWGKQFRLRGDYTRSRAAYHAAEELSKRTGDLKSHQRAKLGLAMLYSLQGEYQSAEKIYQECQTDTENLKSPELTAELLLNSGYLSYSQNRYEKAQEELRKSLAIYESLHDQLGLASTLNLLGILSVTKADYTQALSEYRRCLTLRTQLRGGLNPIETFENELGIAHLHSNIGVVHISQGDYELALYEYQKSLTIRQSLDDKNGIAISYNNLGTIYWNQGNFRNALEAFNKSLKLREELGNKQGVASTLNNIGLIYSAQGNYEAALSYFQKSNRLREELNNRSGVAQCLNNIGNAYRSLERHETALEFYNKSLQLNQELKKESEIAHTLTNLGTIYQQKSDYARAVEYYQKGLEIREKIEDKPGIAESLVKLAEAEADKGNSRLSLEYCNRAIKLASTIGLPATLWEAYTQAGKAHIALKQIDKAIESFDNAIATIETWRGKVAGGERALQKFFENKVSPYHLMIDLLYEQNRAWDAFAYSERAKGRVLLDVLRSGRISTTISETSKKEEQKLIDEITTLNGQLFIESHSQRPDKSRVSELQRALKESRLKYEAFRDTLISASPELRLKSARARTIDRDEIAPLLSGNKEALLEYTLTKDSVYLFLITEGENRAPNLKMVKLGAGRPAIATKAYAFRDRLASLDLTFRRPAIELNQLLLGPIREELKARTSLIIVPDGELWELPFQAFVTPENRFLIEDFRIAYAPSLTVLREITSKRKKIDSDLSIISFGNPASSRLERLPDLPEAEKQVRALSEIYGKNSFVYTGERATEERAKSELPRYDLIHFATHGILDNTSPIYSYLLMSTKSENGNDGLLEAAELMDLNLNASLTILSACETARGRVGAGEGMMGFSWSLFVAGCPSAIVSQWKVESSSTTELMVEFHKNIKGGFKRSGSLNNRAESLRTAALKILSTDKYKHPFYWAPFVLIGDGS